MTQKLHLLREFVQSEKQEKINYGVYTIEHEKMIC